MFYEWRPYVSVAERRRNAEREMQKLKKEGHSVAPVVIEGRTIASTFWGKSWCENLERYSDFASRLPRGRTYVRNGSVVDLQVAAGAVSATVSGSELYTVKITVTPMAKAKWSTICRDCSGAIDSLVELLQGRFSKGVMERICQQQTGLFPMPAEIELSCSCPDWASMCKHVAAVLYGVGARLDEKPELLFLLRQVDENELIAKAGDGLPLTKKTPTAAKVLSGEGLSELFGLEMESAVPAAPVAKVKVKRDRRPRKKRKVTGRKSPGAKVIRVATSKQKKQKVRAIRRAADA